jgi:hypothetical protein
MGDIVFPIGRENGGGVIRNFFRKATPGGRQILF